MAKISKQTKAAIQIALLFNAAIIGSFIPESFPSYFGDWICNGSGNHYNGIGLYCTFPEPHHPEWHWGNRHWLWMLMSLSLFILGSVTIINYLDKEGE